MTKAVSELWRYHVAVLKPDRSEDVEPAGAVSLATVRKPEKEPKNWQVGTYYAHDLHVTKRLGQNQKVGSVGLVRS